MLSSCNLFLSSRVAATDPGLQPIDVSSDSQAVKALMEHNRAEDLWEQELELEARQAVVSCYGCVRSLILDQQPTLFSCMATIISELRHRDKSAYADLILIRATNLAVHQFGNRHPLTVFLAWLRFVDLDAQQELVELFLTRGIALLRETDPNGSNLRDLTMNFEYQLKRLYEMQGRHEDALNLMKRRAYNFEIQLGHYNVETLSCIYQIARAYFLARRWQDAKFYFEDVMVRLQKLPAEDPNHSWFRIHGIGRLAQVYKKLEDDVTALKRARECLRVADEAQEKELSSTYRLRFVQDEILES